MSEDQAIKIVGAIFFAFLFRYLHEFIKNYLKARKDRKGSTARQP